jgi:uncharacterized protein (TIGR01244 family)
MMKRLLILLVSACLIGCAANATAPTEAAVVAIPAEQIRADQSVLSGKQYVSSSQPDEAILSIVKDAGFAAVIDLRGAAEDRGFDEGEAAAAMGLRYVSLPITVPDGLTYENAAKLHAILGEIDGPVLMHCGTGNRVGALVALQKHREGWSDEQALAAGRNAGLTQLEPAVRKRLAELP